MGNLLAPWRQPTSAPMGLKDAAPRKPQHRCAPRAAAPQAAGATPRTSPARAAQGCTSTSLACARRRSSSGHGTSHELSRGYSLTWPSLSKYVTCDFGETTTSVLSPNTTCNALLLNWKKNAYLFFVHFFT